MVKRCKIEEDIHISASSKISDEALRGLQKRTRPLEFIIEKSLWACGAVSILTTIGIVFILLSESLRFLNHPEVHIGEIFTRTEWQPVVGSFGIWSLINATLMTTATAMCVAIPLGLAAAIYLSEYAAPRRKAVLKPVLEVLAGIPTVVYGYFALTFMTPLLRQIFGSDVVQVYNTASAGLVMGILILPMVASMSEDALNAVPKSLREGAYGLGATKFETALFIIFPAALSGIASAIIVAISRAIGETMIVAIAAGAGPAFTFNPFDAAETMTGHIVRISGGDISYESIDYMSIFFIAFILFLMTLGLNMISRKVVMKYKEQYD